MSKLKRCPFCGGELLVDGKFYVHPVVGCLLDGIPIKNDAESIKRWNTRKPMQNIVERLEAELKLSDKEKERCVRENVLQFDTAKGYANGIYDAIEIVKEEGEINE